MAQVYLEIEGNGNSIPVPVGRARLQRLAKHWHYVMRSRRRWIGDPDLASIVENRAARHLEAIGVKPEDLEAIADAGVVQVRICAASCCRNPIRYRMGSEADSLGIPALCRYPQVPKSTTRCGALPIRPAAKSYTNSTTGQCTLYPERTWTSARGLQL
jgi:hypothetical protein